MEEGPKLVTLEQCTIAPDEPAALEVECFTYDDVAQFKRVKKHTVYKWVREGSIPSPIYTGGIARFTKEQVATILSISIVPGTYQRAASTRSAASKKVMAKRLKAKQTGKPPRKKPTPKKPKSKKARKK